MTKIGFHASHEQVPPSKLLQWTRRAEEAGFDCFFCSDHFHPWSEAQGQAGFSWSWMGAALQATHIPGRMNATLRVSGDLEQQLAWLHADLEFGFAEIFLHNINTNQEEFIDTFAEKVLPRLQ